MWTSAVEAQSISTGGNTLSACAEAKYKNGGPATPLYDYAGEDETLNCPRNVLASSSILAVPRL